MLAAAAAATTTTSLFGPVILFARQEVKKTQYKLRYVFLMSLVRKI